MAEEQGIIIYDPATTNMVLDRMYRNRDSFPFDTEAKQESEKGITSGAVYAAVSELKGATVLNKGYWPDSNSLMAGVPSAEEGSIAYVGANAPTPEVDPGEFKVTVDKELDAESENPIANRAVKDTMDKITTEYNVSAFHPDEGIDGTNKYMLETAIVKVPESLRNVGIKCSFLDDGGKLQTWEYLGGAWAAGSFSQVGSAKIEAIENEIGQINQKINEIIRRLEKLEAGGGIEPGTESRVVGDILYLANDIAHSTEGILTFISGAAYSEEKLTINR